MNEVIHSFNSQSLTMSSIDLLRLVNDARADHGEPTLRRNVFHARVSDELEGEHYKKNVVQNSNGTTTEVLELSIDQCMLVAMRESKGVRRKVLGALKAMDEPKEPAWISSLSPQARIAIADLNQQVEQQQKAIEAAKPAVEFVDRYVSADSGNKGFRQVCKLLNANEREFRQFLSDEKIMYRLGGEWMPYQSHVEAGRFVVKTGVAENEHAYNSAKFTPKGVNWVAGKWAIHNIQEAA